MTSESAQAQLDRIVLHHTPEVWIAEFFGPIARQIAAICGGDTVPTGFSAHLPAAVVCGAIALLNPDAEVRVAEPEDATALPACRPAAAAVPREAAEPDVAALVVQEFHREQPSLSRKPLEDEARGFPALEQARKIKNSLGLMVACSYLREKGWSFEAAHKALLSAQPRKAPAFA